MYHFKVFNNLICVMHGHSIIPVSHLKGTAFLMVSILYKKELRE